MNLHWRLMLALSVFVASNLLCWHYARELATLIAPAVQWFCNVWSADFEVMRIAITQPSREWVFFIDAVSTQERMFPKGALPAQTPLTSSTLVGHFFQPLIILVSLFPLIAWQGKRSWRVRLVCLLMFAPVIAVLDVPLVLLGAMEDVLLYHLDPAQTTFSLMVLWMNFMNGGGRLVLPVVMGGVVWAKGGNSFFSKPFNPS